MKIISFNEGVNHKKQVVVMTMTMHVINTDKSAKLKVKRFPAAISREWKLLDDSEYSIQYPKSWSVDKPGKVGQKFVLFPTPDSKEGKFRDNVNLLTQDLSGLNMSLDQFVEISEKQVRTMVANSVIVQSDRITDACPELHILVYTGTSDRLNLKFVQYYWIRNEKAYILTLTCEQHEYEKHRKTMQKIMNSFKLL